MMGSDFNSSLIVSLVELGLNPLDLYDLPCALPGWGRVSNKLKLKGVLIKAHKYDEALKVWDKGPRYKAFMSLVEKKKHLLSFK